MYIYIYICICICVYIYIYSQHNHITHSSCKTNGEQFCSATAFVIRNERRWRLVADRCSVYIIASCI